MTWEVKTLIDGNSGQHFTGSVWVGSTAPVIGGILSTFEAPNPQIIALGATTPLTWGGSTTLVIPAGTVGTKRVKLTFSGERQNAGATGTGTYQFTNGGVPIGFAITGTGAFASPITLVQVLSFPAGTFTLGVQVTCSAGVGDAETVSDGTFIIEAYL